MRIILPRGWALTPALQGGNVWRAYQEARVEAALVGGDIRLFIHLPVFEFNYGLQIYRVYPMPLVTSQSDSVAHYYDKLAPYLGVSPDRQLPLNKCSSIWCLFSLRTSSSSVIVTKLANTVS